MREVLAQDNKLIRSLIQNVRSGNNSSFEQLYNIHAGRVYALCLRLLADKEMADRTTKDVFINALKNILHLRSDITFGSWLGSIAVYSSLEKLRMNNNAANNTGSIKLNGISLSPFENAVLSLPQKERLVFILHDLEKYTEIETAELTSINASEVKAYLDNAYSLLQTSNTSLSQVTPLNERINSLSNQISPNASVWKLISSEIYNLKNNTPEKNPIEETPSAEETVAKQEKIRKFNLFGWRKK